MNSDWMTGLNAAFAAGNEGLDRYAQHREFKRRAARDERQAKRDEELMDIRREQVDIDRRGAAERAVQGERDFRVRTGMTTGQFDLGSDPEPQADVPEAGIYGATKPGWKEANTAVKDFRERLAEKGRPKPDKPEKEPDYTSEQVRLLENLDEIEADKVKYPDGLSGQQRVDRDALRRQVGGKIFGRTGGGGQPKYQEGKRYRGKDGSVRTFRGGRFVP